MSGWWDYGWLIVVFLLVFVALPISCSDSGRWRP